jgi:hypothetical protein
VVFTPRIETSAHEKRDRKEIEMKYNLRNISIVLLVLSGGLLSSGCNLERAATPTPTPAGGLSPADNTPTPTTVLIPGVPDEPTAGITPPPPTGGELELRFTDVMTQKECTARFPFDILEGGQMRRISGSGILDCHQTVEQCGEGVCILYHSKHYLDGSVAGVIHPATADFPDGFLEATLAGTYSLTQYWSDYPPDSVVAFTEDHPSVFSGSDIINLNFNFADGATDEIETPSGEYPWVVTLHLR